VLLYDRLLGIWKEIFFYEGFWDRILVVLDFSIHILWFTRHYGESFPTKNANSLGAIPIS